MNWSAKLRYLFLEVKSLGIFVIHFPAIYFNGVHSKNETFSKHQLKIRNIQLSSKKNHPQTNG